MNDKEYLSEKETQKISKILGIIGAIMIICGVVGFIVCSVFIFGNFLSFETRGMLSSIWVLCGACAGFGLLILFAANRRKITAYMLQQQIPVAMEGMEKLTPAAKNTAKEIAKGVKEGLKDDEK